MDSLTLKCHNSFQDENHRKTKPLIFKFQQEVLKFDNMCMSWSSPKTDLETNFLNLQYRSFKKVSFSQ